MCKADIDGMCWAPAMPGTNRVATRHCLDNGTWGISDYSKCRWVYEETVYCTDRTCYEVGTN
uniref:Uncharacterized protein n=1 Tax=Romanomermis culicivorax TaxID=13658 RepID=A0A915IIT2_ROMCU